MLNLADTIQKEIQPDIEKFEWVNKKITKNNVSTCTKKMKEEDKNAEEDVKPQTTWNLIVEALIKSTEISTDEIMEQIK